MDTHSSDQDKDKDARLARAAAAAKALAAKKKAEAAAAAAADSTDNDTAAAPSTTSDDKAARLARAAAAAKALAAKKKAEAAAAAAAYSTDNDTAAAPSTASDDKIARLARAAAAAKALAAKKKAEAAAAAGAADSTDNDTAADPSTASDDKAARLARAAAAAKALAAKKKAEKEAAAGSIADAEAEASASASALHITAIKERTSLSETVNEVTTEHPQDTETSSKSRSARTQKSENKDKSSATTKAVTDDDTSARAGAASAADAGHKVVYHSLFAGFILALVAALCTLGVMLTQHDTQDAIERNRALQELSLVRSLMPEIMEREEKLGRTVKFECKLISHKLIGNNMRAYILRNEENQVLGYISTYSTSRGYSNPLILIGGIDPQGHIGKIDVQLSRETPGIGDKVERRRGNFLDQFDGQTLLSKKWDVKKFGGDFDYITGATVTSRALVLATRDFLEVMSSMDEKEISQLHDCSR